MSKNTVVALKDRETIQDPLTKMLRNGAQQSREEVYLRTRLINAAEFTRRSIPQLPTTIFSAQSQADAA